MCSFNTESMTCFVYDFVMPHEICTCEVTGRRRGRVELSRVDVLVNITIVAVKRLIKRSYHNKTNCLPIV